jgi:hypothetical protein
MNFICQRSNDSESDDESKELKSPAIPKLFEVISWIQKSFHNQPQLFSCCQLIQYYKLVITILLSVVASESVVYDRIVDFIGDVNPHTDISVSRQLLGTDKDILQLIRQVCDDAIGFVNNRPDVQNEDVQFVWNARVEIEKRIGTL